MNNPIQILREKIEDNTSWQKNIRLKRNEYLVVGGQVNSNLFLVESGCLRIFVLDEHDDHTIRFGYKNDVITALDSFLTGKPTKLYIQALKATRLISIEKKYFSAFINESEQNKSVWITILESFVVQQMEREQDILISSPQERFKRILERSPHLFQEVPDKYIASYLRMTPETFSRIKKSYFESRF